MFRSFSMVNLGKYTSLMNPVGTKYHRNFKYTLGDLSPSQSTVQSKIMEAIVIFKHEPNI